MDGGDLANLTACVAAADRLWSCGVAARRNAIAQRVADRRLLADRQRACFDAVAEGLSIGIHRDRPREAEKQQRHQDRLTTQHFEIGIDGRALAPMHEPRAKILQR